MTDGRNRVCDRLRVIAVSIISSVGLPMTGIAAPSQDSGPAADGSVATIVVQGRRLNVESKIDRKVYTVPDEAQTSLGTLSDVLSVIPSVDVDPDGVVALRGDSNVLILIDGVPATQLQGSKAGDNLQSIAASNIERIEVLTTPPAQYKAEGTAGVINIITRQRRARETAAASLTSSLGSGGRWLAAGTASYSGKQFSAALNAGFREDFRDRTIDSLVTAAGTATEPPLESRDHARQLIRRNIPTVGISGAYNPNDRQSLALSASWLSRGGLRTYTQYDVGTLVPGSVTSATRRLTSGHDPEDDYNTALRYSQKFDKPGETLDAAVHHSISHQHEHYDYIDDSFVPPLPTRYDNLSFTEDNGITGVDLDLTVPLWSHLVKLGYSFEEDDYAFDRQGATVDPVTGVQTIQALLTNRFSYLQRIHAVYLSAQGGAGAWSWLAGARTEWTTGDAVQVTDAISTGSRYADLFPSLHVDRHISDRETLSFGVSRRISRPNPSYLNPYVDYEYPPNLTAGDANLRPQLTQSFELSYGIDGQGASYSATGYYRRNRDGLTDVTTSLGNGLTVTTKTNLPRYDSAGVEFLATGPLLPKLTYDLSGNAFYAQFDASALGSPGLQSTTGLNLKAKLDFRPTGRDSAQIAFTRTDKRLTPQGSINAINIVNLGYKRTLTPALSAVLTVSDVFNGQSYRRFASSPVLTQSYERTVAGRIAWLGLSYAIGRTTKEKPAGFEYESGG